MNLLDLSPSGADACARRIMRSIVAGLDDVSGSILGEYDLYTEVYKTVMREYEQGKIRRKQYQEKVNAVLEKKP
jgi:hypothetical protein